MKICTKCKVDKPLSEFYKHGRNYLRPECRACIRDRQISYLADPEKKERQRIYQKEYRAKKAEERRALKVPKPQKLWPSEKQCMKCHETKQLVDFHVSRHGKFGRAARCKKCMKVWHATYYWRPGVKERINAQATAWQKNLSPEQRAVKNQKTRKWFETLPTGVLGKNLRRALKRFPTENPVTVIELLEMWERQEGKCVVSGIEMTWGKGAFYPTSLSVDRINPEIGYTKGNVRLVLYAVNAFKGRWTDEDMIAIARAMVAKADDDSREPTWQPHLVQSEAA